MAKFTENLPFLFKDEKENPATVDSLRERMQAYQALAKPENYCFIQTGERIEIHFQPPDKMKAQDQVELRQANQYLSWMSTSMWAQKTLEEGSPSPSMTLEQAVEAAKNFATSEDFLVPYSLSGDLDSLRLQAIAGVAAAVLNTVFDWAVSEGLIDWCTGVLLAAARAQRHSDFMDVPETQFPADPKVSAGRGLGKLIEHGRANQDVREQILKLMGDPHFQVVQSVISGLQGAWDSDRCLCWNALSLGLNLACPPRSSRYGKRSSNDGKASAWVEEQIEEHLRHLDNREFPDLPNIDETDGTVFRWKLGLTIICSLPLSTLAADSEAKASLLRLTDDLMRLTIRQNELESERQKGYWHQPPWAWNSGFLRWAARLAHHLNLEECRRHILEPIRDCWATSPHLTADLLFGYIDQQIRFVGPLRPETSQVWREIAEWVLNSQEVIKGHYLERDVEDALALLVFVRFGRFLLDNGWTHIDAFSDVIDNWVSVVGHLPRPYANLLELLSTESASTLDTSIMLKWLGAAMASDKPDDFWSESSNGVRTARLLQRLWASREEEIGSGPSLLQVYSQIVDELVTAGVPLAGLLRRRLERRA